ncbi:hypothetical protein OQJ59_08560 [Microbulbifer thermotolerans]|uniref:hypothetical protein n=1 Tax=Microbulbifer thermotolerans TaxID=252514 RepID=UPI0020C86AE5|nr:hypothetical protein [Microbulbifer thermotolerans]MCX2794371.1 hypothetical protein [Microbulbifer thermotolerans]MCX2835022.1 hypothetical protein [Microbulbifer thermotolerans]MCX2841675.1 hypothetical protein [Microbulbifer thermotolerans]
MVKLGQQLSFALDSGTSGCTGDVFSQLVDSRLALQVGVPGQVDNAHAASAERAFNLVAPQLFLFRFGDFHGFSVVGDYLLQKLQLPPVVSCGGGAHSLLLLCQNYDFGAI